MDDLFTLPSETFCKSLLKAYEESKHPRDEKGRWTAGGAAAALGGAALLAATPGISNVARAMVRFNPKDYAWRRYARTGAARRPIVAAFRSPYEEAGRRLRGTHVSTFGELGRELRAVLRGANPRAMRGPTL